LADVASSEGKGVHSANSKSVNPIDSLVFVRNKLVAFAALDGFLQA
jgi:hypothetical protein